MKQEPVIILDEAQIELKLRRMAWQIREQAGDSAGVTLIGIEQGGLSVANQLAREVKAIGGMDIHVLPLKVNKKEPLSEEPSISEDLTNRAVILVDDVANSGRTLLYALRPLLKFKTEKMLIAVLIDRKHKAFPVSPDIVGHSLATTLQDHIVVEIDGERITGAYLH